MQKAFARPCVFAVKELLWRCTMSQDNISRVAVFGTGQMGPGIAVVTTLAGCPTSLIGRSAESAARGQKNFEAALDFLVAHEAVAPDQAASRARSAERDGR